MLFYYIETNFFKKKHFANFALVSGDNILLRFCELTGRLPWAKYIFVSKRTNWFLVIFD